MLYDICVMSINLTKEQIKRIIYVLIAILVVVISVLFFINNELETAPVEEAATEEPPIEESFTHSAWVSDHTAVKGIYVTGPTAGTERRGEIIQLINDTELNAIVLDVKDDNGNITFDMNNEEVIATGACIPYIKDITALIKQLKENDIYVIARIPVFKDPTLAVARPDLALFTDTGEPITDSQGNAWVNPCKEEVWDYNISIAETCCDLGFDEIQFDYVRFPVTSNSDSVAYGVELTDEERGNYISSFLNRAANAIHEKDVPVSADVFGTIIKSEVDANRVGQDYQVLATSVDVLCSMIYPSHYAAGEFGLDVPDAAPYETVLAALDGSKKILLQIDENECAVIRPWLQAFTATWVVGYIEYDGTAIRKQIDAVKDAGYEEWILWNSKSVYSRDGLN